MFKILTSLIVTMALLTTILLAAEVDEIIENVQDTYDDMENLTATFKQIEMFKLTGSKTEMTGKIYVADGIKYRFESDDQVIVTDGKTIWSYNRLNNQVMIDHVKENSSALLPRDLLFKYPKTHYATLLGEEEWKDKEVYIVKLDSKEDVHGYVKSVKLWIDKDDWHIWQVKTTDMNNNQTIFKMLQIDTKQSLGQQLFHFQPDSTMEVMDRR
ncbi:MAG: hypothetical protein GF313_12435 [Caldithrix sp.]|nr:hypothetical protein [Caldithrix sp.]